MLLHTARIPWFSMREAVTADDTAITDFKRANWPAKEDPILLNSGQNGPVELYGPHLKDINGVTISAWGAGGDDKVITGYKILGVARGNGPILTLLSGAMISGSLACSVHPLTEATLTSNFWVDTITVTGGLLDGQHTILDSGNNRICGLKFDTDIFDEIWLEYDEAAGGMTEFNAMITGH